MSTFPLYIQNRHRQEIGIHYHDATKAWVGDAIDRPQYFRICHIISASLDEDLQFLSEHIDDTGDIPYSIEINGLQTAGLACHKAMDKEGNPLYVFPPSSRAVNEYAIKGAGANAIENFNINEPPFKGTSEEEQKFRRYIWQELTEKFSLN